MFTTALFIIAKSGTNANVHYFMNEYTKCNISIQWNIIQP